MKRILISSESFTIGGLETHIRSESASLINFGCEIHLAVGELFDDLLLPPNIASVTKGLEFGVHITSEQLISSVERLREIIREKNIDFLHAHPFTSLIPSFIAAELEGIPFGLTLHGPASFASYYGPVYDLLLKSIILPRADLIVAVSKEVEKIAAPYVTERRVSIIPNGVSFPKDTIEIHSDNIDPRWILVSRLDAMKSVGVADFVYKAKEAGIPGVVLVGDGPAKKDLVEKISQNGLVEFVEFYGVSDDVHNLMQKFTGVAGMGRVVLEGISAKRPVALVGYDGVKGILDQLIFDLAAETNFSGRGLKTIDSESFRKQLGCVSNSEESQIYKLAMESFEETMLWEKFLKGVHKIDKDKVTLLADFYQLILKNNFSESTPIFQSVETFDRLGDLVFSPRHYDQRLAMGFSHFKQRLQDTKLNGMVAELTEETKKINHLLMESDLKESEFLGRFVEQENKLAKLGILEREQGCEIAELKILEAEQGKKIIELERLESELEKKITTLTEKIKETDIKLHEAALYREDKEIYIASLIMKLQEQDQGIYGFMARVIVRLKRTPIYFSKSIALIRSAGLLGFIKALDSKVKRRNLGITTNYIQPSVVDNSSDSSVEAQNISLPLLNGELVIITGVPFDDVGGGQRAAQLARCALKAGRQVYYIYIYKKFDFETNQYVDSDVKIHGLYHRHIDATSPLEILRSISSQATLLVELPHSAAMPYLDLFNSRGIRSVFELIDDWETSLGGDWFDLSVYHQFVANAKCVVGTAKLLQKRLQDLGRSDALYLPNAANEYIFDKYKSYSRPIDLPTGYRLSALYFGSLYGEWFAWDYIQEAALRNPDIAFLLIGDRPTGKVLPNNVYLLGPKLIDELPGYLAHTDFGLLPFSPGKISDAVSPIKIFEYLFAGRPVVSTALPEVLGYPGVLVAESPEDFAYLCNQTKVDDSKSLENDRFISNNSWFSRLDSIIGIQGLTEFSGQVSVIVLIHNNRGIIGRFLESLLLHCSAYIKEVIVVDNASADGGAEYVEESFPSVQVIRNPMNGCASGRNLGVSSATGKYLAFFDSDQWITSSSCFEEALSILKRDANVGAVGWAAGWFDSSRSDLGGMITDYCPNRAMNDFAIRIGYRPDIGYLGTGGFFMPKVVFNATDGFDVAYDPTCFEDTDISFQIKKLGFDVCYRDLTGIRHQPHQTTGAHSNSEYYTKLFNRNSDYFKKKWINHPEFFQNYPG
ncbi:MULTISPECIES: glycosyltransferase [Pseudomonas]|uniref:glycosyltransferase n=1 Tax=Pseudomonas TaxID=286 RepID=UPI000414ACEC|nr:MULTISPECIES: glycosyltransferase [Pseudomonas]AZD89462.1 hypothetical protein C4K13_0007 [Pseudomonas chlororaphis subsp. aureofaciens]AZD95911.1 hypothetical protein C4K12_0007 [Pseudomonas chlororaphis subsp. aureofaciens]AZE02207.1 hypothetical protein C4K11_0007 [Pseudomonas chlororaphis subsp. aureofaciens]AZE08325.1 hypothetical protein C4K10_0007 [Pseudomonas chlororaphis subsp. aureofaciens]KAA5831684.1 glycosyltransferase [Pseudomonas chlororaphis]